MQLSKSWKNCFYILIPDRINLVNGFYILKFTFDINASLYLYVIFHTVH